MAEAASVGVVDFTNVKDGGAFTKKRQKAGDYKAKVIKVVDAPAKKDNINQWLFTIQVNGQTYPLYCKHVEDQYWKLRNLLIACGMNVPKKKVKVDPNKLVGKELAVTLDDAEYEGKAQSEIGATFPLSELSDDDIPDEPDDVDDADDDEDDAPVAADDEDDDDDGDQFTSMDRTQLKQHIAAKKLDVQVKKSMSDDDIRGLIRAASMATDDDDDDLEEIDIDDT